MIHNLSGMQKLTIKIFEAVQIINVRVKYLTKKLIEIVSQLKPNIEFTDWDVGHEAIQ